MFKRSQPVLAVRGIQQAVCINLYIKDGQSSSNTREISKKDWGGGGVKSSVFQTIGGTSLSNVSNIIFLFYKTLTSLAFI